MDPKSSQTALEPPARMQRDDAATHALERDAAEAGRAHYLGKRIGPRKPADRFDQVAIGLGIADHGTAERRDHVERVEVVERVEARHIDGGELETEEAAAEPQHAIS